VKRLYAKAMDETQKAYDAYRALRFPVDEATCKQSLQVPESEAVHFRRYLRENAEEVRKWPEWMRLEKGRA
jgi:hypothetical protein